VFVLESTILFGSVLGFLIEVEITLWRPPPQTEERLYQSFSDL